MKIRTLALAVALTIVPTLAHGYVRTRTSTGTPVEWRRACPTFRLDATENPAFPHDRLRAAFERSAAAWNDKIAGCTALQLAVEPEINDVEEPALDGINEILWRLPGFCDYSDNARADVCVSPNAAAITTVFYYDKPGEERDGELIEFTMQINATSFEFGDDGGADKIDMQNTMTHELGHVLGLDHACTARTGSAAPVDDHGMPVPNCQPLTALPDGVRDATMFNYAARGETKKRIPTDGEAAGICAVYATRDGTCEVVNQAGDGCACRTGAPIGFSSALLSWGAAVVLLARMVRRRR